MPPSATVGQLVVRLGIDVSSLPSQLASAERSLESAGTRMFFLGSRIAAGIGAPLGAAMTMVAKFGMEFDKAMTESVAIMENVTPQIRREMETTAKSLTENTKFSATEGAKAFYYLASAGLDSAQSMKALPVVAKFAQAGVMDLEKSTEFLTQAQTALGMSSKDATENQTNMARIADVLTEANNRAQGTVEDFAASLTNAAAGALRTHNKSVEEGVAVLTAYANTGIKGRVAGTQLYMVIRDLEKAAVKNAAAFKANNIQVFDMHGNMRNLADILADLEKAFDGQSDAAKRATISQLGFQDRSSRALTQILGMSGAIRDMQKHLEEAGGATDRVAKNQMQSLSNQMEMIKNRFEVVAIEIFNQFVPVIQTYLVPAVLKALDVLRDFSQWLSQQSTNEKAFLLFLAAIPVLLGPAVAILGSFTLLLRAALTPITALLTAWQEWRVASLAVNGALGVLGGTTSNTVKILDAFGNTVRTVQVGALTGATNVGLLARGIGLLANPVTASILAVGLLAGAIYLLTRKSDELESQFKNNSKGFIDETTQLRASLKIYDDLSAKTKLTTGEKALLEGATRSLADASGLSVEAFKREIAQNGDLVKSLHDLATARREAAQAGLSQALDQYAAADQHLKDLQSRLDDLRSGKVINTTQVTPGMGERPQTITRPMTIAERLAEEAQLRLDIKAAEDARASARTVANQRMGSNPSPYGDYDVTDRPKTVKPPPGEGGVPEAENAKTKKVRELREELQGLASKDLVTLRAAWAGLSDSDKNNISVLQRVWEKYEAIRKELGAGVAPEIENSTAQNMEFWKSLQMIETNQAWEKLIRPIEKGSEVTQDYVKHQELVVDWFTKMALSAGDTDAWFRTHDGDLNDLVKDYKKLPAPIQAIVDKWLEWKKMVTTFSPEHHEALIKAGEDIEALAKNTAATVKDKSEELVLFSQSYIGKEFTGLKKGLEARRVELDKHYDEALRHASLFAGQENTIEGKRAFDNLRIIKEGNAKILAEEERIGLLRLAEAVGVNKKIIRENDKFTDDQIRGFIRQRVAFTELMKEMHGFVDTLSALGDLAQATGLGEFGAMLTGVAGGLNGFLGGAQTVADAENITQTMAGLVQMTLGAVKAFESLRDVGSSSMRAVGGAMAGFTIGNTIVPGWGGIIGAAIGALAGVIMGDPSWKKLQTSVLKAWDVNISKELAKKIDADTKRLGGHFAAMLLHLSDIANESGGISLQNVNVWARRLSDTFSVLARGEITTAQAAEILDANFGNLLKVGTDVNGLVSTQIQRLVVLERQYRTGSDAIKQFVDAQLTTLATGTGKMTAGFESTVKTSFTKAFKDIKIPDDVITKLWDAIGDPAKMKDAMKDFGGVMKDILEKYGDEADKAILKTGDWDKIFQAVVGHLRTDLEPEFDRLSNITMASFNAMIRSGKSVVEAITTLGGSIDSLILAAQKMGFAGNDAFNILSSWRNLVKNNQDLFNSIDGLVQVMVALNNIGMMDQATFTDLTAQAMTYFDRLIAAGATHEQALIAMQPALQTIWELQHKFGLKVDETTQKLLDEATAAGIVGKDHEDAMTRIADATERLVNIFETVFADKLPKAAEEGARRTREALDKIPKRLDVDVYAHQHGIPDPTHPNTPVPDPPAHGTGGFFNMPHLAVVGDKPEFITPRTSIGMLASEISSHLDGGGDQTIIVQLDSDVLIRKVVKKAPGFLTVRGV